MVSCKNIETILQVNQDVLVFLTCLLKSITTRIDYSKADLNLCGLSYCIEKKKNAQ